MTGFYRELLEHHYGPCMVAIDFGKYCDRFAIWNYRSRSYLGDWKPTIEKAWEDAGRRG